MARVEGAATPQGTERFQRRAVEGGRVPAEHFRTTHQGLHLSSLGLGTYIGPPDAETDFAVEQAVGTCLASRRVNVLDTAINYRYQRAERSVGRGLRRLLEAGSVARDEVFVSTKNGYLAPDGESTIPVEAWVERELIEKGTLDPDDIVDGSHAMSVSYLADQFERSRRNLGLETVDLLYLHNAPDAQLALVGWTEFRRRLLDAFALFEGWRTQGRLVAYGLATWECLRAKRTDPGYLSLARAVEVAREAAGEDHGFRFVQFPFNLGMSEAAAVRNQMVGADRMTLFQSAERQRVHCFTSVPLFQGQLARSGFRSGGLSPAQTAIQFARSAPGTLGPLIGQKQPEHLSENLSVADRPPWSAAEFAELLRA
jgi:aryl-alcohol dehydrogenase-like predicted oxidoreductase